MRSSSSLLLLLSATVCESFGVVSPLVRPPRVIVSSSVEGPELDIPRPPPKKTVYATFDEAEAAALALCKEGDYAGALPLFDLALTLPGDGFDVR